MVLLGFTIGLFGYFSMQGHDRKLSTVFSTYGALLLVGAILQPEIRPLRLENFHLLLLALFGVIMSLVAIGAIARRDAVIQTTGVVVIPLVVAGILWVLQLLPIADMPALPVGPAVLVILAIIPGIVLIGYGGQLVYHRLKQ